MRELRDKVARLRMRKQILEEREKELTVAIKSQTMELHVLEQAQTTIQQVAQSTQAQLEYHINELASLALKSIFDQPYELKVDFVVKRGKTEAEVYFVKDGVRMSPSNDSGGGAVDVAAFALRLSLWSLQNPKSRNTIILDEPFRFLSKDLHPKVGDLLKQVSERLGIQLIIVTHEKELQQYADKVFTVDMVDKISYVK